MAKKTLLVMTSTFPRWLEDVVPSFVFDLSAKFTDDYEVIVLAPHAKGTKRREAMMGMEVIRYRYFFDWGETLTYRSGVMANVRNNVMNYLLIPPFFCSQLFSLIKLLRSRKIDIIQAHWSIPQGLVAVVGLMLARSSTKLICSVHGSDLNFKGVFFRTINRAVFSHCAAITSVSQSLREKIVEMGITASKLTVIPMGVDAQQKFIPAIAGEANPRNKLLFVGRLVKSKGVDTLIKAMKIVQASYPEQQLIIIGDGPERDSLKALAHILGISTNITFLGAKSHNALPEFYRQANIFISPTLAEGFGLTLAEALACKCAVIVSDLPAVRDLIIDKKTGLVFEAGNAELLAQNILKLLSDKELLEKLAASGREKVVKDFDWDNISYRYKMVCSQLLEN